MTSTERAEAIQVPWRHLVLDDAELRRRIAAAIDAAVAAEREAILRGLRGCFVDAPSWQDLNVLERVEDFIRDRGAEEKGS